MPWHISPERNPHTQLYNATPLGPSRLPTFATQRFRRRGFLINQKVNKWTCSYPERLNDFRGQIDQPRFVINKKGRVYPPNFFGVLTYPNFHASECTTYRIWATVRFCVSLVFSFYVKVHSILSSSSAIFRKCVFWYVWSIEMVVYFPRILSG